MWTMDLQHIYVCRMCKNGLTPSLNVTRWIFHVRIQSWPVQWTHTDWSNLLISDPIQSSTPQLWDGFWCSARNLRADYWKHFFFFNNIRIFKAIPLVFIQSHWPSVPIYKPCAGRNSILERSRSMRHTLHAVSWNLCHTELTHVLSFRSELTSKSKDSTLCSIRKIIFNMVANRNGSWVKANKVWTTDSKLHSNFCYFPRTNQSAHFF